MREQKACMVDPEQRPPTLDERIAIARQANLDLYLESPSPETARILVILEQTIQALLEQRKAGDDA